MVDFAFYTGLMERVEAHGACARAFMYVCVYHGAWCMNYYVRCR